MFITLTKKELQTTLGDLNDKNRVYINGYLLGFEPIRFHQQFVQEGHAGWTLFGWFFDEPDITEIKAAHLEYGMLDIDLGNLVVKATKKEGWEHFFQNHLNVINVSYDE